MIFDRLAKPLQTVLLFVCMAGGAALFVIARDRSILNTLDSIRVLGHPNHRLQDYALAQFIVMTQVLGLSIILGALGLLLYRAQQALRVAAQPKPAASPNSADETIPFVDPEEAGDLITADDPSVAARFDQRSARAIVESGHEAVALAAAPVTRIGSTAVESKADVNSVSALLLSAADAPTAAQPNVVLARLARLLGWLANNPAVVLSILVAITAVNLIPVNSVEFGGERIYYLADDAMISMRYARNFADGSGLIWNQGERVEGYTNFLWVLVMSAVHAAGTPEAMTSFWVMVINWLMVIAMVWMLQAILRRLGVHVVWLYAALLLFVIDENIIYWCFTGLETILNTFLVMGCIWAMIWRRDILFTLFLALTPLARSDAALATGFLALAFIADRWKDLRWRAVVLVALAVLPSVGQQVFRMSFYGEFFPNTYYQKLSGQIAQLIQLGMSYSMRLIGSHLLLIVLMLVALFMKGIDHRLRWFGAAFFAQVAYMTYAGGDAFRYVRFLTPLLPALYVIVAVGLQRLSEQVTRNEYRAIAAGLIMLTAPVSAWDFRILSAQPLNPESNWTMLGQMIERNIPTTALISVTGAGAAPYFAEDYRFVDALGLNDAYIAHLEPPTSSIWIGHNKFDYDYVYLERRPDLLVTTFKCHETRDLLAKNEAERQQSIRNDVRVTWAYFEIYHPVFQNSYLPNPVILFDDGGAVFNPGTFCLFKRADSPIADVWTQSGKPLRQATIDFDFPYIAGDGWSAQQTNRNNVTFRRMAGDTSTIHLPLEMGRNYRVSFRVAADSSLWDKLSLNVNGQPVELIGRAEADVGPVVYEATLPASAMNLLTTTLTFHIDAENADVIFDWLKVEEAQ